MQTIFLLSMIFINAGLVPWLLLCCMVSYLVGALPFGLWTGLLWKGVDIRTLGSKNIGATNVLRVLGPAPAALVFLLDAGKGVAGVLLARMLWSAMGIGGTVQLAMPFQVLIGLCAVLGHSFSPFLRFKGGKAVTTSLGVLLALGWQVGVVALVVWTALVLLTRYVSLSSIAAAVAVPISALCLLTGEQRLWMTALGIVLATLVIVKHRPNIQRLLTGTESRIGERVQLPATDEPAATKEQGAE